MISTTAAHRLRPRPTTRHTAARCPLSSGGAGFTLIELIVVISLLSIFMLLFVGRTSTFGYWRQESFIRRLNETIVFLHNQAISDQAFYRLEFTFGKLDNSIDSYRVGVLKGEPEADAQFQELAQDAGNLTLELAAFLSPSSAGGQSMIPPPLFPSMAEPVEFPEGVSLTDVRTMRGKKTEGKPYVLFSPRGFSEFSVIHLKLINGSEVTILVNPFSGLTEIYREYKDFEWSYGRDRAR